MTIEYAIRILDPETSRDALWKYEDKEDRLKVVNEACRVAVDALRAQCDAPLTLEELREMDGEPVWNDTIKKWVLVDLTWEFGERTVDADGKWRGLDDRYYRRKPEEGTA